MRVHLATATGEQIHPDARSVGFLADGSLLLQPTSEPSDASLDAPLKTLATKRCGLFAARKP